MKLLPVNTGFSLSQGPEHTGFTGATVQSEFFGGVLFSVTSVTTIFTENKTHRKFRYYRYCRLGTSTLTWKTGFTENFPPPNRRFWRIPKILHHRKCLLFQYVVSTERADQRHTCLYCIFQLDGYYMRSIVQCCTMKSSRVAQVCAISQPIVCRSRTAQPLARTVLGDTTGFS